MKMNKKDYANAIPKYSQNEVDFMLSEATKPYHELIQSLKQGLDFANRKTLLKAKKLTPYELTK